MSKKLLCVAQWEQLLSRRSLPDAVPLKRHHSIPDETDTSKHSSIIGNASTQAMFRRFARDCAVGKSLFDISIVVCSPRRGICMGVGDMSRLQIAAQAGIAIRFRNIVPPATPNPTT